MTLEVVICDWRLEISLNSSNQLFDLLEIVNNDHISFELVISLDR